jgi:hypothetical protein
MPRYVIHLDLPPEKYLDYYRGTIRQVVARCTTGQNIQFPAALLRPHVTHGGIRGTFALSSDDQHKNVRLERVE